MRSLLFAIFSTIWLWAPPSWGEGSKLAWTDETASPRPALRAALSARDRAFLAPCAASDAALDRVAERIARGEIAGDDAEGVTYALRVAGEPHVWPRAILLRGLRGSPGADLGGPDAQARFSRWFASAPPGGQLRCGISSQKTGDQESVAAIVVSALADLEPLPRRVRASSWVEMRARVLVRASGAKVIALGPSGPPRTVPTSLVEGQVRARINLDRPGTWTLQLVLDGDRGPRPVLEALVFAGVAPPDAPPPRVAPGEEATAVSDPELALVEMVTLARASQGLSGLQRDALLAKVARAHCERMRSTGVLGHDVGFGDPRERLNRGGVIAREVGENVAHAESIGLAHRALWASPSHRDNILQPRFDRIGVGVCNDTDGSVWVTEAFATH